MNAKHMLLAVSILTCGSLAGCDEPCVPAEIIRVKLGETVYKLPAAYRPDIFGTKLSTRYVLQNGHNVQEYCQKPEDPPSKADSFGLSKTSLEIIAGQHSELSQLRGVELVEINDAPAGYSPAERMSGNVVSNGLYRRVDHNGTFELFSTTPLLFGSQIAARCGPAPKREPTISCDIWGQISPGTLIRVRLNESTHPSTGWPSTLNEVEHLIKLVKTPKEHAE